MRNKPYLKIQAAWIILFFLALTGRLFAQEWTELDRTAVIDKASAITRERYPDADVVVLDQHNWVKFKDDGTYVEWFEQYIKVLTEKGKRRYRTLTSSFNIPYNSTKFTRVEVISPDGTSRVVDVDKNSRVMVDSSQMASNIYDPNDKMLQVSIPELNIGDTVHFITFDDFFKARMAGEFSDYTTFEDTDPIVRSRLTIVAPATKPLRRIALKSEIPGTVTFMKTDQGSEVVYQWVAKDVPRAFEEPEMPPLYTQAQRVLVSTIPDWETISRWYWKLSKPHLEKTTSDMRKTVKGIIKAGKGPRENMEAVFFWVSQKVRYLGITAETEAPGYEPHDVSMTFERRAGVCRDKTALLVAMLRLAGFEAYPVLIMNGPRKDPEVPQPFFNHAIACVKNRDGSYILMDPTNENTRELFPAYLNNQSYVVATPLGDTLHTSPITPAGQNMLRIATSGKIDAKGTLSGKTTITFSGINDNAYRGHFSRITHDERKLFIERMLMKAVPGALLKDLSIEPASVMDTSKSLKVGFSFAAQNYPAHGAEVSLLPVFRFGDTLGVANFLITKMGLKERKYPYVTETACGIEESLEIELDGSLGKPLGAALKEAVSDEGATWERSVEASGSILRARNLVVMRLTEYTPEMYKSLQETLKKVEKANRFIPSFARGRLAAVSPGGQWYAHGNPDAVILDEDICFDIHDAASFTQTVKKRTKVLNYAGIKKNSELHLSYNPAWEDIRIVKGLVISPGGVTTRINPNEVNVMDQEWVGTAPRYPAGKIKVVSFPGLQEGSIIEYEYERTKKDAWPVFIFCEFQGEDPAERLRLRISMPAGMELRTLKAENGFSADPSWKPFPSGFIADIRGSQGDRKTFEYLAEKVPSLKPEGAMPPGYIFVPTVIASNSRLEDYASSVRQVLDKASANQIESGKKAFDLTKGLRTDEEKISAIRDYCAKNIKSVGIAFYQLPLKSISQADETLSAGYGNSADMAVLMASMLRALDLKPQFLLTSTASPIKGLDKPLKDYPAAEWFVSVLVKVALAGGKTVILGDTDQYAALGAVASSGIPALNVSTGLIEPVTPSDARMEDYTESRYTIDLSPNGDALITQRRTYYGNSHGAFCKDYLEMSPEERRRRFQDIVSAVSRSAVAAGPYAVSCEPYPATEDFSVTVKGYAFSQGDLLSLDLPGITRAVAGVTSEERSNPLYRGSFIRQDIIFEVILPEGAGPIEFSPPESSTFALPGSSELSISAKIMTPGERTPSSPRTRIVIRQHSDIRPALVMPREYPELLRMHQILANPLMRTIVVRMEKR